MISVMTRWAVLALLLAPEVFGQNPSYPQETQIQIPERCTLVSKWLIQGLAAGVNMELIRHDEQAGTMVFRVASVPLSKSEIRQQIDAAASKLPKNARIYEIVLTVRTLVSSSIKFDGAPKQTDEACTIAAGMKYETKDGKRLLSSGGGEKLLLQRFKDIYSAYGLSY
jgi:hypothetical protein